MFHIETILEKKLRKSMEDIIEIVICLGSSCFARGNSGVLVEIERFVGEHGLQDRVLIRGSRCEGACTEGPNLRIAGIPYRNVRAADIVPLLSRTLLQVGHPDE